MKTLRRVKNPVRESNEIVPRDFDFFRVNDGKLDGRFVFYSLVNDGPYSPYAFVLGSDINKLKFEDYGISKVIFNTFLEWAKEQGSLFVCFSGLSDSESKILKFPGDVITSKVTSRLSIVFQKFFRLSIDNYISIYAKQEGVNNPTAYFNEGSLYVLGSPYPDISEHMHLPNLTSLADIPRIVLDDESMFDIPGFKPIENECRVTTENVADFFRSKSPRRSYNIIDIYRAFNSPREDSFEYVDSALDDLEAQGLVVKTGNGCYKMNSSLPLIKI